MTSSMSPSHFYTPELIESFIKAEILFSFMLVFFSLLSVAMFVSYCILLVRVRRGSYWKYPDGGIPPGPGLLGVILAAVAAVVTVQTSDHYKKIAFYMVSPEHFAIYHLGDLKNKQLQLKKEGVSGSAESNRCLD